MHALNSLDAYNLVHPLIMRPQSRWFPVLHCSYSTELQPICNIFQVVNTDKRKGIIHYELTCTLFWKSCCFDYVLMECGVGKSEVEFVSCLAKLKSYFKKIAWHIFLRFLDEKLILKSKSLLYFLKKNFALF